VFVTVKKCFPPDDSVPHGKIVSRSRTDKIKDEYIYPQGVVVTFACDDLYKLPAGNTGRRKCLASGRWSGTSFHCGMSAFHVQCNMQTKLVSYDSDMSNYSQILIGSCLRSVRGQTLR